MEAGFYAGRFPSQGRTSKPHVGAPSARYGPSGRRHRASRRRVEPESGQAFAGKEGGGENKNARPVIGVARVRSDDEAVGLMNDTEYGLTAGVYGRDRERAERILRGVNAGSAYFNCCDRVSPRLPWTGRRNSGIGSTLSKYGILAFVQPKAWHLRVQ